MTAQFWLGSWQISYLKKYYIWYLQDNIQFLTNAISRAIPERYVSVVPNFRLVFFIETVRIESLGFREVFRVSMESITGYDH